jgi:4,5-dihydroxyphthalate decarboxylase
MPNPKLRLGFREPEIDTNRPFVEGAVKVEGFDLEISNFRGAEFIDAWDASFGGLMQTKGKGNHPYVSIPAFPNRKFRLAYIYVNSASGIESPKDLEGKRVFVSSTAGIWARGALLDYYKVDLTRINWFMMGREAKSWAPGIKVEAVPKVSRPADTALDTMLLEGELDAVIDPNVLQCVSRRDPRVRRLFRDYKTEEQNYFKATGIFPALLKAYREARDIAFNRIYGGDPEILTISWAAALMDEQRTIMGENYWSYNVENNVRSLEAMTLYAHQFGSTPTKLDYKSLLHPEAAALPGT